MPASLANAGLLCGSGLEYLIFWAIGIKKEVVFKATSPYPVGAKGTRTLHLLIANQSLYQMSYGPKFF